ncbi:MAG: ABC transporter permease [Myxococcales bacterium]|nr:ABC transporter permease [Myxococcota bacterium]MDW8282578.1 ABC transporter permease [Myxococcales bacterium]
MRWAWLMMAGVARRLLRVVALTLRGALRARREPGELQRQLYQVGNRSLLFVMVTLGFIGMVLVFQTCLQINRVTGDLSQVGAEFAKILVHEFGPSLTAMMLATRVGAGIAAEVGSMIVTEQVDALRMCGVEPVEYLIVPRFLASLVMTLVLSIVGTVVALGMGGLTAYSSFHVPPSVFFDLSRVRLGDVATGIIKCLAYGAAIPIISGFCGLEARGGSEGVGWATTRAVVSSSFAVIVLDFLISGVAFFTLQASG